MKKHLILSSLAFLTLSCEKVIDYKLPVEESKLAVDANLTVGSHATAIVSNTQPATSLERPYHSASAKVALYENDLWVDSLEFTTTNYDTGYVGSYIIQPNKNYRLEVSQEGFPAVQGQDHTRDSIIIEEADWDSQRGTLDISFTDSPLPGDYYSIRAYYIQGSTVNYPIYLNTYEPLLEFFEGNDDPLSGDGAKSGETAFLKDESINGKKVTLRFQDIYDQGSSLLVEVTRMSEHRYLFERSLAAYYNTNGNPFAEPVPVYSNVENGYGVVIAGSPSHRRVEP